MKILISIDSQESSKIILTEALPILKGFPEAEIHIYTVLDLAAVSVGHGAVDAVVMDGSKKMLDNAVHFAKALLGERKIHSSHEVGDPVDEILRKAEDLPCDLLIIGTHGRTGLNHFIVGSVAEKVLRLAPCNTLVVPMKNKLGE